MAFDDVENARKAYVGKRNKIKKKVIWITVGIEFAVILIFVVLNISSFQRISANFSNFEPILIMPSLMALVFLTILPVVIVAIIMSVSTSRELMEYKKAYKGYFVERELAKTFTEIKYSHDAGLDKGILASTGMINTGDRYSSNDLTMGKYKNVNFAQADVHIKEKYEDSDGDTHYRTIFSGRFMIFEFPKKIISRLMLSHTNGPTVGINPKTGKVMQRIETESVDFNKAFLVYAEDGVDAFYILTPDFMERAQELGRSHNDAVSLYFYDNKMVVGIDNYDDIFEPPNPVNPIDEKAEIVKVDKGMGLVTQIIDALKLDRKIST